MTTCAHESRWAWRALSALASAAALWFAVVTAPVLKSMVAGLAGTGRAPARRVAARRAPEADRDARQAKLWPSYPGRGDAMTGRMELNGVLMLTESWDVRSPSADVLDYYRSQMRARGWHEVTEDVHGLDPQARYLAGAGGALEDRRYVESYRDVVESRLVVQRGPWSLFFLTAPSDAVGRARVQISAFRSAPSGAARARMAWPFGFEGGGLMDGDAPVHARESMGGTTYETDMRRSRDQAEGAFRAALTRTAADGWRVAHAGPSGGAGGGAALLTRGGEMGLLVVAPSPPGLGGSVETLTRFGGTPE